MITLERPFEAWGKLARDQEGRILAMHPLGDHMLDVASCFEALCDCAGIGRALTCTAGRPLSRHDVKRLAVLAFLHDLGKANAGFQGRCWRPTDPGSRAWPQACGHGTEGWMLFSQDGSFAEAGRILQGLPLDAMAAWGEESVFALLHASISHHGRPVGDAHASAHGIWQPVRRGQDLIYDPAQAIARLGEWLPQLFPEAFETRETEALPHRPAFVHLFAGLVQLADWLGSDTRAGFFPYTAPGEVRARTVAARARHAVRAIGLDVTPWREMVHAAQPSFARAFGVPEPRPMQQAAAEPGLGQLVVLEAETGSGKTEAALWRFMRMFHAGEVDSLYFALPTRVAATQLHERVRQFVARVWDDTHPAGAPVVIRALPGYEAADGESKIALPHHQVLWADQPGDTESERRWAAESPKRFLAATIAVGTIDQALLGALTVRHAHLRHAMLSRSLLVVDEVHASDAYMGVLLDQLLQAHLDCAGHALLLSATLGAAARTRHLGAGLRRPLSMPSLADSIAAPYPALSTRKADGSVSIEAVAGSPRHRQVHWRTLDAIDEPGRIAQLALDAARKGARVLVIRNTVPAAVATLQAIEALGTGPDDEARLFRVEGVATLHHSRYARQDRPRLDEAVERQIGKLRPDPGGRIVVGTQTLEQSLDLDADLLITDLCPMDVLLQRLGRLHRHGRPSGSAPQDRRPEGFEQPRAWVLTPAGHDLGPLLAQARHGLGPIRKRGEPMQGVYVDLRMLEATRRLVDAQPSRRIPGENRLLVEHATHAEALAAIEQSMGAEWVRFGCELDGSLGARTSLAHLHALPYREPFETLVFPESEQKIATRLGAADRLLTFDPPPLGPFGQPVSGLAVRHHQWPQGLESDAQPHDVAPLHGGGFEFSLGPSHWRYDRFGLQRLAMT